MNGPRPALFDLPDAGAPNPPELVEAVIDYNVPAVPAPERGQVVARLQVHGVPKPQGSHVAYVDRRTGQARTKEQNESTHANWREDVSTAAAKLVEGLGEPLDGALALEVTFRFPMPLSRPKRLRQIGMVFKISAPDTSKLVRSIEDSMEAAGLIANDARFAVVHASKVEVHSVWTGADITIRRLA